MKLKIPRLIFWTIIYLYLHYLFLLILLRHLEQHLLFGAQAIVTSLGAQCLQEQQVILHLPIYVLVEYKNNIYF